MTTSKQHYTFQTKGLTDYQISYLETCEQRWFAGENDTMITSATAWGFNKEDGKGREIIEAWEYWNFGNKPLIRESYKTAIPYAELISTEITDPKQSYYVSTTRAYKQFENLMHAQPTEKFLQAYNTGIYGPISPNDYHLQIVNDALYIKYDKIIGGRLIAFIQ